MQPPHPHLTPTDSPVERPTLFKVGVGLLVLHELIVMGLCALAGGIGAIAFLFGSLSGADSKTIGVLVLVAGFVAMMLMILVLFAGVSLAVCALAWGGSRTWLQALIGVALVNCVVVAPNPFGILASVVCVLGTLRFMDQGQGSTTASETPPELPLADL